MRTVRRRRWGWRFMRIRGWRIVYFLLVVVLSKWPLERESGGCEGRVGDDCWVERERGSELEGERVRDKSATGGPIYTWKRRRSHRISNWIFKFGDILSSRHIRKEESVFPRKWSQLEYQPTLILALLRSNDLVSVRETPLFLLSASNPSTTTVNEEVTLTFFTFFLCPGGVIFSLRYERSGRLA